MGVRGDREVGTGRFFIENHGGGGGLPQGGGSTGEGLGGCLRGIGGGAEGFFLLLFRDRNVHQAGKNLTLFYLWLGLFFVHGWSVLLTGNWLGLLFYLP